jgi:integrase
MPSTRRIVSRIGSSAEIVAFVVAITSFVCWLVAVARHDSHHWQDQRRRKVVYGSTEREAVEKRDDLRRRLQLGVDLSAKSRTVRQWLEEWMGLRRAEILGLRWSDVDVDERVLSVRQTMQRLDGGLAFVEPKTHRSRRTLPLSALAVARSIDSGCSRRRMSKGRRTSGPSMDLSSQTRSASPSNRAT